LLLMAYVDNTEKMELKDSFSESDSLENTVDCYSVPPHDFFLL
jgi:hypothetical protein